ncbi:MFS transporter [Xenorhabdus szentirmaii]|uniref:MFS transporter n=1 Tax=Xenorhabdus szentirmaii TaxID=290112 RepID=UPI000C03B11E|nr:MULTISPECIES: MFS transporter [Xenorhabdus]MBD2779132.1 MFS transporter [Xenorhabdus sp. 38]MBD2824856.1 MFS transporter [Xenorhabdus sp. 5]PHM44291.1 tetracycline-resistance determinant tetV [Xenorhabdus szentirmaii]
MTSFSERASPYSEVLRTSSFRKLLIGQGLSMIGDAVCLAALPVALIHANLGADVFGIVMASVGIGTVIGALAGGVLADRKSPKHVLIATDTVRGLAQVAATVLIMSSAPWWWLVFAYLIFGIGIGVSRPCAQVLLVNLLPKQALVAGNGAMNFIDNFVAVVFPATIGVVIILWDPVWGILLDGITFFAAAVFTAMIPNIGVRGSDDEFSIREALNGIRVITGNSILLLGFIATLILNVLCFPIFLVVAPYAISDRFSDTMWGFCLAASGAGACIGSVLTVLTAGHQRLILLAVICGLFLCSAMLLLGLGSVAWMVILGATFIGVVEASWLTGWATAMQILSPEKDLGKVVAVDTFVTSGAHPFIYLGAGIFGAMVGYSETLTLTAIVSAAGIAVIALAAITRRN